MSVRIAIANPKGGVGKSLTTMMLADGLALSYGARVLVLDADPQAGVTKALLGIGAEQQLTQRQIGLAAMLRAFASGRSMRLAAHRVAAGDLIELHDRKRASSISCRPITNFFARWPSSSTWRGERSARIVSMSCYRMR